MSIDLSKERDAYAEWLVLKNSGDEGKKRLADLGYSDFTKKSFCEKHNIDKNTPKNWESNTDFWNLYYSKVTDEKRASLPAIVDMLGHKAPQDWLKVMFPKQARAAFKQEIDMSGEIKHRHKLLFDEPKEEKEKNAN